MLQGLVDLRQIAVIAAEHDHAVWVKAKPSRAGLKCRPGLRLLLLTDSSQRGKEYNTVRDQRLEHVILHDRFARRPEMRFQMAARHLLKRVFKQLDLLVGFN